MPIPLAAVESRGPYDCCIVGAGPAGIVLALDLAARGQRVLLCEGGGFERTDVSQAVYRSRVVGDPYRDLEFVRLRCFGGTSGYWGGVCRPLDAIDFEPKPHHPQARWPIGRAELDPYLPAASAAVEIGPIPPDAPIAGGILRASWEQEPRAANRIELSPGEVDRFGVPRTVLHWRKAAEDRLTVQRTALDFARFLAERNVGRVRLREWVLGRADYPEDDELTGNHHMGGTRMAASPQDGVVDADLRVHGQPNLYVLGSSTFPSGGHANPTLTILQLAHRLAEHLTERV